VFDGHYPILIVPRHIGMASIKYYRLSFAFCFELSIYDVRLYVICLKV